MRKRKRVIACFLVVCMLFTTGFTAAPYEESNVSDESDEETFIEGTFAEEVMQVDSENNIQEFKPEFQMILADTYYAYDGKLPFFLVLETISESGEDLPPSSDKHRGYELEIFNSNGDLLRKVPFEREIYYQIAKIEDMTPLLNGQLTLDVQISISYLGDTLSDLDRIEKTLIFSNKTFHSYSGEAMKLDQNSKYINFEFYCPNVLSEQDIKRIEILDASGRRVLTSSQHKSLGHMSANFSFEKDKRYDYNALKWSYIPDVKVVNISTSLYRVNPIREGLHKAVIVLSDGKTIELENFVDFINRPIVSSVTQAFDFPKPYISGLVEMNQSLFVRVSGEGFNVNQVSPVVRDENGREKSVVVNRKIENLYNAIYELKPIEGGLWNADGYLDVVRSGEHIYVNPELSKPQIEFCLGPNLYRTLFNPDTFELEIFTQGIENGNYKFELFESHDLGQWALDVQFVDIIDGKARVLFTQNGDAFPYESFKSYQVILMPQNSSSFLSGYFFTSMIGQFSGSTTWLHSFFEDELPKEIDMILSKKMISDLDTLVVKMYQKNADGSQNLIVENLQFEHWDLTFQGDPAYRIAFATDQINFPQTPGAYEILLYEGESALTHRIRYNILEREALYLSWISMNFDQTGFSVFLQLEGKAYDIDKFSVKLLDVTGQEVKSADRIQENISELKLEAIFNGDFSDHECYVLDIRYNGEKLKSYYASELFYDDSNPHSLLVRVPNTSDNKAKFNWDMGGVSGVMGSSEVFPLTLRVYDRYTMTPIKIISLPISGYFTSEMLEGIDLSREYNLQLFDQFGEVISVIDDALVLSENVSPPVTGISLSEESLELTLGNRVTITAHLLPFASDNQNIRWSTSDDQVVSINPLENKSRVQLVASSTRSGKAVITARITGINGEELVASCEVTVRGPETGGGTQPPSGGNTGGAAPPPFTPPQPQSSAPPEPKVPDTVIIEDVKDEKIPLSTVTFRDIDNHWAKKEISDLAARGIVSGISPTKFDPNKHITRADFVKILVAALKLERPEGLVVPEFEDVSKAAYYYDYVMIARAHGIVVGDGLYFNPKKELTREDMMTILERALTIVGFELNDEVSLEDFTDAADISNYAVKSIQRLVAAKIIQGYDGKINPKAKLTRAEASVAIFKGSVPLTR